MKPRSLILVAVAAFITGAALASLAWGRYVLHLQIDMVAGGTMSQAGMSDFGQQVLSYMDSPDPLKARRVEFAASNLVACFPDKMAAWDKAYPRFDIKRKMKPSVEKAQDFLRQRQGRGATNGAARGGK